jgi:hypothetical protein
MTLFTQSDKSSLSSLKLSIATANSVNGTVQCLGIHPIPSISSFPLTESHGTGSSEQQETFEVDGTQARRNQRLFEAEGSTFLLISHCLKTVSSRDPQNIVMQFWVVVFPPVADECSMHSNLTIQCRADRQSTHTFYGGGQGIECGPNLQLVITDTSPRIFNPI